jgi:hypothetical protein
MHRVVGSNRGQVKFYFSFMQPPCCYFILYKELFSVLYFLKIYNHTSLYGPIARGASVDPPHKFVLLPCWYYQL